MRKCMALVLTGCLLVTGCTAPFTEAPVATNLEVIEEQKPPPDLSKLPYTKVRVVE